MNENSAVVRLNRAIFTAGKLELAEAVDVYLHEHRYSRLKGKPLLLTPMYLQKEEQSTGLTRLWRLANFRPVTRVESQKFARKT